MPDDNDLVLKNLWYLALPAGLLRKGKLVGRTIAKERLVFGRDAAGKAYVPYSARMYSRVWRDAFGACR